jgi:hypothetical protein
MAEQEEMGIALDRDVIADVSCERCGAESQDIIQDDYGNLVCQVCGAVQTQSRHIVREDQFEEGGAQGQGLRRIGRFQSERDAAVKPVASDAYTTVDFLLGMQLILDANTKTMIEKCGAPAELHDIVGQLWKRYLSRWSHSAAPPGHVIHGLLRSGNNAAYSAKLYADGTPPAPTLPLTMPLLLALLGVACRWLQLPFLPRDLCLWARNGTFLYLNAFAHLPVGMQLALTAAHNVLSPSQLPNLSKISELMVLLAANIGVFLPPVNIPAALLRAGNIAELPGPAVALAQAVFTLDEVDRAHAAAYLAKMTGKKVTRTSAGRAEPTALGLLHALHHQPLLLPFPRMMEMGN